MKQDESFDLDDNEEVEKHLLTTEKGIGRVYYKFWVDTETKNIRTYTGYLFSQKTIHQFQATGPGVLESLGISKLIEHLGKVSGGDLGLRASVDVMDGMLKRPSDVRKIKACHPTEIDQLIQYIEGWKFTNTTDRLKQQDVIEKLGKLK